jgi:hypothetical protein
MRDQGQDLWERGSHVLLHDASPVRKMLMAGTGVQVGPCLLFTRMMKMPLQQQAGYKMGDA